MGDGKVGNEFDIIFPDYQQDGTMQMSETPNLIPQKRRQPTHMHAERCLQQRVLFINGAREATNEA